MTTSNRYANANISNMTSSIDKITRMHQRISNMTSSIDKISRAHQRVSNMTASIDKISRAHQRIGNMTSSIDKISRVHQSVSHMASSQQKMLKLLYTLNQNPLREFQNSLKENQHEVLLNAIVDATEHIVSHDEMTLSDDSEIENNLLTELIIKLNQLANGCHFETLIAWVQSLTPQPRDIICGLLVGYIVAFSTTPISSNYSEHFTGHQIRTAEKNVSIAANQEFYPHELKDYRFVSVSMSSVLQVRAKGNINSVVIDSLKNGVAVKVISKARRWTEIEYKRDHDEIGEPLTGWFFSRYINKF